MTFYIAEAAEMISPERVGDVKLINEMVKPPWEADFGIRTARNPFKHTAIGAGYRVLVIEEEHPEGYPVAGTIVAFEPG